MVLLIQESHSYYQFQPAVPTQRAAGPWVKACEPEARPFRLVSPVVKTVIKPMRRLKRICKVNRFTVKNNSLLLLYSVFMAFRWQFLKACTECTALLYKSQHCTHRPSLPGGRLWCMCAFVVYVCWPLNPGLSLRAASQPSVMFSRAKIDSEKVHVANFSQVKSHWFYS